MYSFFKKNLNYLINFLLIIFSIHTFIFGYIFLKNFNNTSSLIPLIIILILFFFYIYLFFIKNREIKINLIISIIIIYISIYMFEIYLDVTGTIFKSKKDLARNFDLREKKEVIDTLANKNQNTYPQTFLFDYVKVNKSNDKIIYPFGGISYSNTISCNESGYWPVIKRDKFGFSNTDDLYDKNLDFLLIGDSLAEGWCVRQKDNLQSLLNNNNYSSISLGVSGSGPLLQLAVLQEYKNEIRTKKIILFYAEGNDLKNLSKELQTDILSKYYNDENFKQDLKNKQKEIDIYIKSFIKNNYIYKSNDPLNDLTYSNFFYRVAKLSNLRLILNLVASKDMQTKNDPNNLNIINEYGIILNKFKLIAKQLNSELYFVYTPDWTRIKQNKLKDNNLNFKKEVISLVKSKNIKVIDVSEEFSKIKDPLSFYPFRRHGHFNEKGFIFLNDLILDKTK